MRRDLGGQTRNDGHTERRIEEPGDSRSTGRIKFQLPFYLVHLIAKIEDHFQQHTPTILRSSI